MCSGWPEHWLHTLSPPGISHTRLVSSLLGTAPLDPALCPAGASQILVLHGRGRRESLTRPFLNHRNHHAKSFACSGDQIRPWSPVENPQLQVLSFGEVLTAAAVMSRHLQLTEGQGQRPGANGSVCVQQGTREPDEQLVIQPFLKNSPSWRSSHLPKVLSCRACVSLSLETRSKLNMFLLKSSCCF